MARLCSRIRPITLLALLASAAGLLLGDCAAEQEDPSTTGLFLILEEAASSEDLPEPTADQQIVCYDYKFLREGERQTPKYFLLPSRPDVPLLLAGPPQSVVGERGFKELLIELTEGAARDMERVTRENLGAGAAFLIDGEAVTAHAIRAVIKDGRFQLSRCSDNACEYILARLRE